MQENHPEQEEESLPPYDNPFIFQINDEDENGSYDTDEDQRRFDQDEARWNDEREY